MGGWARVAGSPARGGLPGRCGRCGRGTFRHLGWWSPRRRLRTGGAARSQEQAPGGRRRLRDTRRAGPGGLRGGAVGWGSHLLGLCHNLPTVKSTVSTLCYRGASRTSGANGTPRSGRGLRQTPDRLGHRALVSPGRG